ncbi:MAG: phosphoenolpyruvate carboxylase, partial [Thermoleophilia bacterium]|nr:phosphoenolpyruvate carboxylase [Thermoleophilia bacterium]
LVENPEMTLAKSSFEIAESYVSLVLAGAERDRFWEALSDEHGRTVDAVLTIVEADELLDRHPVVQRSIRLRNPYVDPASQSLRRSAERDPGRAAPCVARR